MDREKQIAILIADHCTRYEAEKHFKNGATIYENTETEKAGFISNCIGCCMEESEAIKEWEKMETVNYCGVSYKILYVL